MVEVEWLDTRGIPCTRYPSDKTANLRVATTLAFAAGIAVDEHFIEHLVSLHDHKGCLNVCWKSEKALNTYKHVLNEAWRSWTVEHEIMHFVQGEDDREIYNSHRPDRVFSDA